jgi:hypothetical protein
MSLFVVISDQTQTIFDDKNVRNIAFRTSKEGRIGKSGSRVYVRV